MPITELVKLCLCISLLYLLILGRIGVKLIYVILKTNFTFIIYILSYSPICNYSFDEEFNKIKYKDLHKYEFSRRFSLLAFRFGKTKYYLMTILFTNNKFDKISCFLKLSNEQIYQKILNLQTNDIFREKYNLISQQIINCDNEDRNNELEINKEYYSSQLDEIRERTEKGNGKFNTIISLFSIIITILGYFIVSVDKIKDLEPKFHDFLELLFNNTSFIMCIKLKYVLIAILFYLFINFMMLISDVISIKTIYRFEPRDIINLKLIKIKSENYKSLIDYCNGDIKSLEADVLFTILILIQHYFMLLMWFFIFTISILLFS